jgi:hypothetical protein
MGAWRVGFQAAAPRRVASGELGGEEPAEDRATPSSPANSPAVSGIELLTKWIPGEVIALYAAAVTAFGAAANARPSIALLAVAGGLTFVVVVLTAFARGRVVKGTWLAAILAVGAFAIWSATVPFSGWQRWSFIHNHQVAVPIVAAVAALMFGLLAEGLTRIVGPNS